MSTINASSTNVWRSSYGGLVQRTIWTGLANGDDGAPLEGPGYADRSFQISGTFGTGGTVVIEGSNDEGVTWATLHDPFGNPLSFTSADLAAVTEATGLIRPRVTAGDGTTNIKISALLRSMAP